MTYRPRAAAHALRRAVYPASSYYHLLKTALQRCPCHDCVFSRQILRGLRAKIFQSVLGDPFGVIKQLAPVGTALCQHFFVGKKARKSLSSALCAPFQGDVRIRCDYRALSDLSQPLRYINDFHCLAISQRYRPASPLCAMVRKGNCNKLFFFFFFFFKSIMVRLRYRTICSTLSIVAILLRSSSHLTFAMKKAIPLNPIESALRCARV